MVTEYSASGTLIRRYVHGPSVDEPIVWYEGSSTSDRRWYYADARGSIVAVTNASGLALETRSYSLRGLTPAHWADGPARYGESDTWSGSRSQYIGQIAIPEAGLYYYKARFYAPSLGRFLQTDPIGYADGLNLYAYVGGDPINATDPSGLKLQTSCYGSFCFTTDIGGGSFSCDLGGCTTTFGNGPQHPFDYAGYYGSLITARDYMSSFDYISASGSSAAVFQRETLSFNRPVCSAGRASPVEGQSDEFLQAAQVAYDALAAINAQSIRQNVEYGGLIYRGSGRFGKFGATSARTDNQFGSVDTFAPGVLEQIPVGAKIYGTYHTHGAGSGFEGFSRADRDLGAESNTVSFLGTPGGNFLANFPGSSATLDLSGSFGCLPAQ